MTTASLLIALAWILPFAFGPRLGPGRTGFGRRLLSAAGGSAIAYVFIDLLPEMQEMQERFMAAAEGRAFPFPHYRVYSSALVGFVAFYALEHAVAASRPGAERSDPGIHPTPGASPGEASRSERPAIFWLQIVGFAIYCGMMAYLLREDAETRALSILPYGLAMFFHFWVVDHALRHEHGAPYDRAGRWVLGCGILAGWLVAAAELSSELLLPTLMGFIAGGVVLNSIKGELPAEGEVRVVPFVAGAVGYALLLLIAG